MDAWSADQLKKMQAGGNGKMNTFFKTYGIVKEIDIKEKYAGQVAEVSCSALGLYPQASSRSSTPRKSCSASCGGV